MVGQACRDALCPKIPNVSAVSKNRRAQLAREIQFTARQFLQGDMHPYAPILDLDPESDEEFRRWLRENGMKPVSSGQQEG